jgi:type VI secretion system protein ImpA
MSLPTEALLQPISAEKPGGEDIRYEPIYSQIKQARIEEEDLPTGDWERERKTADWPLVIKLATEALSQQSKDLQLAAWLTEAMLKREGVGGLASALEFIGQLLDGFWDHLYPALEEEDDLEFRAAPLDWVGQYLAPTVRLTPVNAEGHTIFDYRESRAVGYEDAAGSSDKKKAREAALADGKLSAEAFDQALARTSKTWYKELVEGIDASMAALDALESQGSERFGVDAPRFSPLRTALQEVRQVAEPFLAKKLEEDPDPVVVEEPPPEAPERVEGTDGAAAPPPAGAGGGAATAGAATADAAVPSGSVEPRTRAEAEARVAAAALFLRKEDPTDPSAYLLLRGFRWGELRLQAPDVDPKLLTAPPTDQRSRLRTFLLDGRWAELLEGCEQVMATSYGRGWLDLQRYVLEACSGLGSEYDRVAESIQRALQALLQDVPGLPALTLMDDTPTANAETRKWLQETGLVGSAAAADGLPEPRAGGRGPYERAMERVRAGEPEKAIRMLIAQAAQEVSERERFLRRSQAAEIMVDVGREAVALPILQDLMGQIEKHGLDEYEAGEVVARPMGLLFRCMQRLEGDAAQMQELYLRICRLDPMQAIHLQGPSDA